MKARILLLGLFASIQFLCADVIECDNGDRYNGKVLSMDEKSVTMQNAITGKLTIPRARIVSIGFDCSCSQRAASSPASIVIERDYSACALLAAS